MRILAAVLIAASLMGLSAGSWAQNAGGAKEVAATAACCGQQMGLVGQADVYTAPEKGPGGVAIPDYLRTEVYGNEMVARAELPAGTYTVVITGSENSFQQEGKRVFSVEAISGGAGAAGSDGRAAGGAGGVHSDLARDVDLFKLAGGAGKPYAIKGAVKHGGGMLRVVFHSQVDNAKFSSIKVLDKDGNKVAWLFAEDVADLLRLPDVPPTVSGPTVYLDVNQPMEKRVADLVKRMTLREKVGQMENAAPAIARLGVPAYNYWSECLHGVARAGHATVFPQAIGMSATFDAPAMHEVGDVIGTEARAKYAAWQASGTQDPDGTAAIFRGLTFWSPNINLFRDPRWGRGQETYGEDPFLTGTMGAQFIRGLQGDDPKYFKVVATAKHFAVHSGPELLRHEFDAAPPMRDFYESYLPQFEMAVREGKVYSVMGAYNRVYGVPANESDLLLKNILRRDWAFDGYVVSDCGAINDIWFNHKVEANRGAAAAGAVLAGCDLECGANYGALASAVDSNLIGEGAIDRALGRVLLSRFKLGMFDPPAMVKYAAIGAGENDTPEHGELALKMARESIVLLKNDGVLPLAKGAKKIAVVGPNADGLLPLLGNYCGTPSKPVTVLEGIKGVFKGEIVHVRGCDNAARVRDWQIVPDVCLRPMNGTDGETGLRAEHFASLDFSGQPVTVRIEKQVDISGSIEWILSGVPLAQGSSRWSGEFVAPMDGEFRLAASGGGNCRLVVNGQTVREPSGRSGEAVLVLKKGQAVPVVLESAQQGGFLDVQLLWNRGDLDLTALAADRVRDADVIVYVGGLDGRMEAEEGDIRADFKEFGKGDRRSIELPECQEKIIRALVATGKPLVVVNLSGSAVAMPWEAEHVGAIVQAWYPGQAGGMALAEVLFGVFNPAGRLPVTFYRATSDLPPFEDYAMKERTYRYFTGKPLWAFGHGLSYTTFRYGAMAVDRSQTSAGDTVNVTVEVTNTGNRDGDEVVQIYAKPAQAVPGDPLQRLVGFARVNVPAGKTAKVNVPVAAARLQNWDVDKKTYVVPPGTWRLMAGASSDDIRATQEILVQ